MFDKNEPSEGVILVCQNAKWTYEKRLPVSREDGRRQACEHRRANGGLQTLGRRHLGRWPRESVLGDLRVRERAGGTVLGCRAAGHAARGCHQAEPRLLECFNHPPGALWERAQLSPGNGLKALKLLFQPRMHFLFLQHHLSPREYSGQLGFCFVFSALVRVINQQFGIPLFHGVSCYQYLTPRELRMQNLNVIYTRVKQAMSHLMIPHE